VPVVLGFTAQGSGLFREWRTRCREIGVILYQRDDLIVADEDAVTDEIARMLLDSANIEAVRSVVAVACDMNSPSGSAMFAYLEALGLTPVAFDAILMWDADAGLPSQQALGELFRKVQAVVVLFSPSSEVQAQDQVSQSHSLGMMECDPESRVQVAAGMALGLNQARTILVRSGQVRESLALYAQCIELDGSERTQAELIRRLKAAGCQVRTT
jgi:hypothetical protein